MGNNLIAYHLPGAWGLESMSPFCLKLDLYLRMAGIPHQAVTVPAPFKGPNSKAPWIELDGRKMGDSTLIIQFLNDRFDIDLDRELSLEQRAVSRAMRAMIDENLYWVMVYERWLIKENFAQFKHLVLGGIPQPIRTVFAPIARRGVRKQCEGHGLGLHSREDIDSIGARDLKALSDWLGDKDYLMGEHPSEIDAAAFGLLANIVRAPFEGGLKKHIMACRNLEPYVTRIQSRYY